MIKSFNVSDNLDTNSLILRCVGLENKFPEDIMQIKHDIITAHTLYHDNEQMYKWYIYNSCVLDKICELENNNICTRWDNSIICPFCKNKTNNIDICEKCNNKLEQDLVYEDPEKKVSCKFKPIQHFITCLNRVLGKDVSKHITSDVINQLAQGFKRRNIIMDSLTINDIRAELRIHKFTKFNSFVSYLHYKLTKKYIPAVSDGIINSAIEIFSQVIQCDKSHSAGQMNRHAYFYYIYKILEYLIPLESSSRGILKYIYLQKDKTLRNNDMNWRDICVDLGIPFIPTI